LTEIWKNELTLSTVAFFFASKKMTCSERFAPSATKQTQAGARFISIPGHWGVESANVVSHRRKNVAKCYREKRLKKEENCERK